MSEYQFTQDWFHWAPKLWEQLVPMLPERKKFLEIGSFEGRSAVWIVENMMEDGGEIYCIDTWEGGEEHINGEMVGAEERFGHNIAVVRTAYPMRSVVKYRGSSVQHLAHFLIEHPDDYIEYDFIYIDGSHVAKDVLTDACMAWPLLKPKGLMVFDDYMWGAPKDILQRPKLAIDVFTNIFAGEVELVHVGYQLVVRKKEQ